MAWSLMRNGGAEEATPKVPAVGATTLRIRHNGSQIVWEFETKDGVTRLEQRNPEIDISNLKVGITLRAGLDSVAIVTGLNAK